MKFFLISLATVTMIIFCGCEDPIGPGNCPNHVDVTVQIKEQPIFSWSPSCEADNIIVYYNQELTSGLNVLDPVWSIEGKENGISPPIIYGINPEGTIESIPAIQLIAGEKYTLKVIRKIESIGPYDYIGELDFLYIH